MLGVENFFPVFPMWKDPKNLSHPLWMDFSYGPKGLPAFSTFFPPTDYYYEY